MREWELVTSHPGYRSWRGNRFSSSHRWATDWDLPGIAIVPRTGGLSKALRALDEIVWKLNQLK
jgi:hypothetical protein